MLEAGEDPLYIARRLVRFASEDVGMADSRALEITVAAYQACHFIGMPECNVHLTHAVSLSVPGPQVQGGGQCLCRRRRKRTPWSSLAEPVPLQIRNAPTGLMKELRYGEGYQYRPTTRLTSVTDMQCLPDSLGGTAVLPPGPLRGGSRVRRAAGGHPARPGGKGPGVTPAEDEKAPGNMAGRFFVRGLFFFVPAVELAQLLADALELMLGMHAAAGVEVGTAALCSH